MWLPRAVVPALGCPPPHFLLDEGNAAPTQFKSLMVEFSVTCNKVIPELYKYDPPEIKKNQNISLLPTPKNTHERVSTCFGEMGKGAERESSKSPTTSGREAGASGITLPELQTSCSFVLGDFSNLILRRLDETQVS